EDIESLFTSALAVRPEDRPTSLSAWWQELERAASEHTEWAALPPVLKPAGISAPGGGPNIRPDCAPNHSEGTSSRSRAAISERGSADPTPDTQSPVPRVSSDFFTHGDALTREATRHSRRHLGVWVTSGVVGACSALIGVAVWLDTRPRQSLSQTTAALSPVAVGGQSSADVQQPDPQQADEPTADDILETQSR